MIGLSSIYAAWLSFFCAFFFFFFSISCGEKRSVWNQQHN